MKLGLGRQKAEFMAAFEACKALFWPDKNSKELGHH